MIVVVNLCVCVCVCVCVCEYFGLLCIYYLFTQDNGNRNDSDGDTASGSMYFTP